MINFTKFLLIGTLFAGAASSAFASPLLTGTLDINGTAKVGGTGIISYTTNPAPATNGTGVLSYFDGSSEIKFTQTFTLAGIKPGVGELLFTMTAGKYTDGFYVTGYTFTGTTYTFTGYLTENGVAVTNATLVDTFTTKDGNLGTEYTAQLSLTPEPSSVFLLGTGLLAACGMLSIKRRRMLSAAI